MANVTIPDLPAATSLVGTEPFETVVSGASKKVTATVISKTTWAAETGDVTTNSSGVTAIGASKVAAGMIAANAVTTAKILDANVTAAKLAAGANGTIAGCTVAADGTATNTKNIASVARTSPGSGEYTVTLTANTATKYAAFACPDGVSTSDPLAAQVHKTSATVFVVQTFVGPSVDDTAFNFILNSLD